MEMVGVVSKFRVAYAAGNDNQQSGIFKKLFFVAKNSQ
jgi:hypothetical protein